MTSIGASSSKVQRQKNCSFATPLRGLTCQPIAREKRWMSLCVGSRKRRRRRSWRYPSRLWNGGSAVGRSRLSRRGRRVYVRMHGPEYLSDDELLRRASSGWMSLSGPCGNWSRAHPIWSGNGTRPGNPHPPAETHTRNWRRRIARSAPSRKDQTIGFPAWRGRGHAVCPAGHQHSGHVATVHVGGLAPTRLPKCNPQSCDCHIRPTFSDCRSAIGEGGAVL